MRIRRLVAPSLVAAMVLLTSGALLSSVHTSERISYFSPPPPGTRSAVHALHDAVSATLGSRYLTYDNMRYEAPARTKYRTSFLGVIVIAQRIYVALDPQKVAFTGTWGTAALNPQVAADFGVPQVMGILWRLRSLDSVRRTGEHFVATQVMAAASLSPGNPGQVKVVYHVDVVSGRVTHVVWSESGWITTWLPTRVGGPFVMTRVSHFSGGPVVYGSFAGGPAVVAPPASHTVALGRCFGGGYVIADQGRRWCEFSSDTNISPALG